MTGQQLGSILKAEDNWVGEGGKDRHSCERNFINSGFKGTMTRLFKGRGSDWQTFKEE